MKLLGGDGAHCVSGDKKLCCTADLYKDCYWDGTAPVCSGECKGDYETGTYIVSILIPEKYERVY